MRSKMEALVTEIKRIIQSRSRRLGGRFQQLTWRGTQEYTDDNRQVWVSKAQVDGEGIIGISPQQTFGGQEYAYGFGAIDPLGVTRIGSTIQGSFRDLPHTLRVSFPVYANDGDRDYLELPDGVVVQEVRNVGVGSADVTSLWSLDTGPIIGPRRNRQGARTTAEFDLVRA